MFQETKRASIVLCLAAVMGCSNPGAPGADSGVKAGEDPLPAEFTNSQALDPEGAPANGNPAADDSAKAAANPVSDDAELTGGLPSQKPAMTQVIPQLGSFVKGGFQTAVGGGMPVMAGGSKGGDPSEGEGGASAVHVFARVKNDLHVLPSNYSDHPAILVHLGPTAAAKGGLWQTNYGYQFFPAPAAMSLDESPVVAQTEKGFHVVSRSGDKLIYWQCAYGIVASAPEAFDCKVKVLNNPETGGIKPEGCVGIASDALGRVHVFAKNGDTQRWAYFSGTDFDSVKLVAPEIVPTVSYKSESCMGVAFHPFNKRIYVVSRGEGGNILVAVSDPIYSTESVLNKDSFKIHQGPVAYKFNGGMSSCGENGRVTLAYDPSSKKLVILNHEEGGQNGPIARFGIEGYPNSPLLDKALGSTLLDSLDIDDYPVGVFNNEGGLHVFADKAHIDRIFEGILKDGLSDAWDFAGPVQKVERAPAVAFDPKANAIHLFVRKWGDGNPLVHYVKTKGDKGWVLPDWYSEILALDGATHFEGCPTAVLEQKFSAPPLAVGN